MQAGGMVGKILSPVETSQFGDVSIWGLYLLYLLVVFIYLFIYLFTLNGHALLSHTGGLFCMGNFNKNRRTSLQRVCYTPSSVNAI